MGKPAMARIERLIPYARNARTHSPAQIDMLVRSIDEYGWMNPVIIDAKGGIIAGHGRVLAAQRLGIAEVPVMEVTYLTEKQKRAYIIADNKLALLAGWGNDLLNTELSWLAKEGFDVSLTGFSGLEIEGLTALDFDPDKDWAGMPDFDQPSALAFRSIVVHMKDQVAVDAFAKRLKQRITDKTRFVWFPFIEIESYADKNYGTEEPSDVVEPVDAA